MAVMRSVGNGRRLLPHALVREDEREYVIELDVSDFGEPELAVEALGPVVTVLGEQLGTNEDDGLPFRLRERLEESFRLPDDADAERLSAFYKHGTLELHAPRRPLTRREVPIERRRYIVDPGVVPC